MCAVTIVEEVVLAHKDMDKFMEQREQTTTSGIVGIDKHQGCIVIYQGKGTELINCQRAMSIASNNTIHHDDDTCIADFRTDISERIIRGFRLRKPINR